MSTLTVNDMVPLDGVIWLPRNVEIKALDKEIFQGTYGVVRRVTIHGASFIPSWIEWVGKTIKATNSLENRKERSIEALACQVDHPEVIKLLGPEKFKKTNSLEYILSSLRLMVERGLLHRIEPLIHPC